MNSFQNVFSVCVDKVKVRDGAGRAHVVSKADGKRAAEGRLELEPASAFSDKREDPKISALRLMREDKIGPQVCSTNCGGSLLAKQNDI